MNLRLLALALLACAAFIPTPASAAIVHKDVPYNDGDTKLMGYFAYDDALKGPLPGVIIVHEWWGSNDYVRHRADQLAALGYAAFAADMYGQGVLAKDPAEATALSKPFYADPDFTRRRARAGIAALKAQPQTDPENVAAIGYCFGGTVALELARGAEPLKGVVSFHGGLATADPAKPGSMMNERVLSMEGGADKLVPQKDRDAFIAEMKGAGANFKTIEYPGALHAFTNPDATALGQKFNMPIAYDAEADKQSFAEMQAFLAQVFKK